jgi:formate/nitrite transporter FocA (FNT family)
MDKRKWLKELVYGILAGFCIGLGGTFLLSCKNTAGIVVAALFFTIGLFTICERGYNLFTGKVCYVFDNKPKYLVFLLVVWVGNLLGCMLIAFIERCTSINDAIQPVAAAMVDTKMSDYNGNFALRLLSLFFLGLLCDVFIFIAVNGYAKSKYQMGKYLSLIFGVTCFIVCGTEHSIADMYYWCISGKLYTDFGKSILCLLVITLGNSVGGFFFPAIEKFIGNYKKQENPAEPKVEAAKEPEQTDDVEKENA